MSQHRYRSWGSRDSQPVNAAHALLRAASGRVLLLLRSGSDFRDHYGLPGGRIDQGEDHQQAVIREIREEIGVDLAKIDGAVQALKHLGPVGNSHIYLLEIDDEFEPTLGDGEHSDYGWALPDELPDNMHPNAAKAIAQHCGPTTDGETEYPLSVLYRDLAGRMAVPK